jgi:hypothetical protein
MRARYIREIGTRYDLRVYWDEVLVEAVDPCAECPGGHPRRKYLDACPNSYGAGGPGTHECRTHLRDTEYIIGSSEVTPGTKDVYPAKMWPTACENCGAPVPAEDGPPAALGATGPYVHRQVTAYRLYDTASGKPEPGDVFRLRWHAGHDCPYWDNCDGVHLYGVTPNGQQWDITSRANNCGSRQDRLHRCWIQHGDPPDLTIDKSGNTCSAGGGSIQVSGWHGFLRNGEWIL